MAVHRKGNPRDEPTSFLAHVLLAAQLPYYRLAPQEWSVAKFGGR